jgi:hypothetical protein
MADYYAIETATDRKFLIRRADSENHARQLLRENIVGIDPDNCNYVALNAGSVAVLPNHLPDPMPETPPLPETDNPFSGSPAG